MSALGIGYMVSGQHATRERKRGYRTSRTGALTHSASSLQNDLQGAELGMWIVKLNETTVTGEWHVRGPVPTDSEKSLTPHRKSFATS